MSTQSPIVDITEAKAQALDALRTVRLGADCQVDLLKLSSAQGYEVLATYTDGWLLTQGDFRNPDQIEIADVNKDRAENIAKARAFGIPALGLVYALQANGMHAPATAYRRVWLCYVDVSGERWPQT